MTFVAVVLSLSISVLFATPALSQTQNDIAKSEKKWRTSMGLSAFSIDSANTGSQGLGESAFGLDIAGNYYFSPQLVTSLGLVSLISKTTRNSPRT